MTDNTEPNATSGLDPKALEAARATFLSIFGDPSAVPADYGLVAATIRAYLESLASTAPLPVEPPEAIAGLLVRLDRGAMGNGVGPLDCREAAAALRARPKLEGGE